MQQTEIEMLLEILACQQDVLLELMQSDLSLIAAFQNPEAAERLVAAAAAGLRSAAYSVDALSDKIQRVEQTVPHR